MDALDNPIIHLFLTFIYSIWEWQVDASDLTFRLMCIKGGATLTYTQMYTPEKLKQDEEYRRRALKDLEYERSLPNDLQRPVIVQLGGRDIDEMIEAARLFAPLCDGIGVLAGLPFAENPSNHLLNWYVSRHQLWLSARASYARWIRKCSSRSRTVGTFRRHG